MPKIVDHDNYRKEMLAKCFSLFSARGFSSVTMKEVAAEIGVSTGTLYHYFPTKESILGQMIAWAGESNTGEYKKRTESTGDISERFRLMREFWKENGGFYRSLMLLSIDMKRLVPEGESEKVFGSFSNLYTEVMSERLNISKEFARSIFIYFIGLVTYSILIPGMLPYAEHIDKFSAALEPFVIGSKKSAAGSFGEAINLFINDTGMNG